MGIGVGPWDIFLNPLMGRTEKLPGIVPKENGPSANGDVVFDNDQIVDLPALADALRLQVDRVDELASTLTINEIEDFATEMISLAVKHRFNPLEQWSEKLTDAAGMFDLDAMSLELDSFERLIDSLTGTTT